jgi:chromosome segregation ATPase
VTSEQQEAAASTDAMRAEANQITAAVREENRALWERSRRAVQLAYEADLIDAAEMAKAAYDGAASRLERLEAGVAPLVAAEREADDRLRSDRKRLARRSAELDRARTDSAPGARREDLAVRVHELAQVAAASEAALARARSVREQKETEVTAWEAEVASYYADYAGAASRAVSPGIAPGMPPPGLVVGRISDLDEEARQLIAAVAIMAGSALGDRSTPAAPPDRAAILKDPGRFRVFGPGVIVPPRMP